MENFSVSRGNWDHRLNDSNDEIFIILFNVIRSLSVCAEIGELMFIRVNELQYPAQHFVVYKIGNWLQI